MVVTAVVVVIALARTAVVITLIVSVSPVASVVIVVAHSYNLLSFRLYLSLNIHNEKATM